MFDIIIYFEKVNNNRFCSNFAFFASNFKDFFYIFIVVIYANINIFVVSIIKFANIAFKQNKKFNLIFIFEIFCSQTLNFVI